MTNSISTNATAAIAVRDASDAAAHGARPGHSFTSDSGDLALSFQNILHKGARIDTKDVKASLSVAHLTAREPTSPPDIERSSWRPSHEDDASASDLETADDESEWDAGDRTPDEEVRETADPTSDANQIAAGDNSGIRADEPEFADVPLVDGADTSTRSALGGNPPTEAAGSSENVKDAKGASDPLAARTKAQETVPSPADPALRSGANAAARPGSDGAPKATATASQANELAKSLPAGNDVKINVAVAKPGDTLFSQPASSLAAASVADGQKPGSRPGQVPVGASAKAGFTAAAQPGQAPAAAQPGIQVNGKPSAGDLQLQTGAQGNQANPAAPPSKGAASPAQTLAGSFADVTGIGSSGAPQAAQRAGSGPVPPAGTPAPPQPPVSEQISVQISKAVKAGIDRIDIQLRPKELGRVDVRLELAGDGRVNATVTVDNRETLELLKTDARGLEKALDDAGLKTDSNSLNFNLRGQDGRPSGNQLSRMGRPGGLLGEGEVELGGDIPARTLGDYSRGGLSADGRLDIEI